MTEESRSYPQSRPSTSHYIGGSIRYASSSPIIRPLLARVIIRDTCLTLLPHSPNNTQEASDPVGKADPMRNGLPCNTPASVWGSIAGEIAGGGQAAKPDQSKPKGLSPCAVFAGEKRPELSSPPVIYVRVLIPLALHSLASRGVSPISEPW
jgi:hypothetical protein